MLGRSCVAFLNITQLNTIRYNGKLFVFRKNLACPCKGGIILRLKNYTVGPREDNPFNKNRQPSYPNRLAYKMKTMDRIHSRDSSPSNCVEHPGPPSVHMNEIWLPFGVNLVQTEGNSKVHTAGEKV